MPTWKLSSVWISVGSLPSLVRMSRLKPELAWTWLACLYRLFHGYKLDNVIYNYIYKCTYIQSSKGLNMVFHILWIFPCSQLLDLEDFSKVTRVDMSKTGVVKNWNEDKGFGFIGLEWAVKIWGWVKTYYCHIWGNNHPSTSINQLF